MNLEKEILFKLVDKLERSKDFKNGNLTSANIYLTINDSLISPLFSSTGYLKEDEYERAFSDLKKRNFVFLKNRDNYNFRIVLNLSSLNEVYEFLNYKGKKIEVNEEEQFLKAKEEDYKNNLVLQSFLNKCITLLHENKNVNKYFKDHNELEFILKAIDSIMNNKGKILLRNFSVRVFNNSKIVENNANKIFRIYNEFSNEEFKDFNSLIEHYYIYRNFNLILIKGDITLKINEEIIHVGKLNSTFALSSEILDKVEIINLPVEKVITIENQTTFNYFSDSSFLVLYTDGYISSSMAIFLKKLYSFKTSLRFYHFGDIDWGGINIYLDIIAKTGIKFNTYKMDIETLKEYQSYAKSLTEKDKENLISLIKNAKDEEMLKLVDFMLSNNIKLEQEAID